MTPIAELEPNKRVVAEYVEAFNAGDYERLRTLFAPDALIQGVLGRGSLELVLPIWRELHQAFGIHEPVLCS